jgi:hypothetical protein
LPWALRLRRWDVRRDCEPLLHPQRGKEFLRCEFKAWQDVAKLDPFGPVWIIRWGSSAVAVCFTLGGKLPSVGTTGKYDNNQTV